MVTGVGSGQLTGAKVTMRAPQEDDLDALHDIASELATWEERTPRAPTVLTRAAYAEQFTQLLAEHSSDDTTFVIAAGGELVGRCDLFSIDQLARNAEVGIALRTDARGRGYGTDALRVLVDFAFTRRNLHRVHLSAIASNLGGLACYAKVGFVEEGRRRQSAWVRGAYQDEVVMGLLRSEWPAR